MTYAFSVRAFSSLSRSAATRLPAPVSESIVACFGFTTPAAGFAAAAVVVDG